MAPRRDGHAADDRCFVCAVFSVEGAWGASLRSVKAMGTMADRSSSSLASSLTCWRRGTGETRSILVGEAALCIIRTTRRRPSMEALSIIMVSEVRPGPGLPSPTRLFTCSVCHRACPLLRAARRRGRGGSVASGRPGVQELRRTRTGPRAGSARPSTSRFRASAARVRRACRERVRAASRLALTCVLTLLPHPRPSSSSLEESGSTGAAV